VVDAGQGVAEAHGYPAGEARCQAEHPFLPAAGQVAGVEGADRGLPVDLGHRGDAVGDAGAGVDEFVLEVLAVRPAGVADEQVDTCLQGVDAAGTGAQCDG
jgi:hypothetical protein